MLLDMKRVAVGIVHIRYSLQLIDESRSGDRGEFPHALSFLSLNAIRSPSPSQKNKANCSIFAKR